MKLKHFVHSIFHRGEIVARFGAATLIKAPQGQWQLVGGTRADRSEARQWASLFLHEAVLPADPAEGNRGLTSREPYTTHVSSL